MANRQKGEVSFRADDKEWVLRYSTNALCEMEDLFGKSAIEVAQSLDSEAGVSLKDLRAVFYCGLTDRHEDISEKRAGDLIDDIGMEAVGPLIAEAFLAAFPSAEEEQREGKSRAAAGRKRK